MLVGFGLFFLPIFADIDPAAGPGVFLQLWQGEFDGGAGAAAGREYGREAFQGYVEPDGDAGQDREGADAANGMADAGFYFLRLEHLCLGVELLLEFVVIDMGIAGSDDEDGLPGGIEGKGLGDAGRLAAEICGGQPYCGAGAGELQDAGFYMT